MVIYFMYTHLLYHIDTEWRSQNVDVIEQQCYGEIEILIIDFVNAVGT